MSVCDGLQMGVILALAAREDDFKSVWGSGWSSDALKGWGAYLRLGFPSLILFLVEWVSWDILVFLAGILGKVISLVITGNGKLLPADLPRRKLPETGGGGAAGGAEPQKALIQGVGQNTVLA